MAVTRNRHSQSSAPPVLALGYQEVKAAISMTNAHVKNHTLTRLDSFVAGVAGKRLTYKALIQ